MFKSNIHHKTLMCVCVVSVTSNSLDAMTMTAKFRKMRACVGAQLDVNVDVTDLSTR